MSEERYIGKVVWFSNKLNYGFISRTDEDDLFVHWSDIEQEGFKTLRKGQEVTFAVGLNKRGEPKAINVSVINAEKQCP